MRLQAGLQSGGHQFWTRSSRGPGGGDTRETPAPRRLPAGSLQCTAEGTGGGPRTRPCSTRHHLLWQQPGLRRSLRSASTCCPVTREATLAQRGRGAQSETLVHRRQPREPGEASPQDSSSAHTSCHLPGSPGKQLQQPRSPLSLPQVGTVVTVTGDTPGDTPQGGSPKSSARVARQTRGPGAAPGARHGAQGHRAGPQGSRRPSRL